VRPGASATLDITDIRGDEPDEQRPYIPVFNSDDRFAFYCTAFNNVAVGAARRSLPDRRGADDTVTP